MFYTNGWHHIEIKKLGGEDACVPRYDHAIFINNDGVDKPECLYTVGNLSDLSFGVGPGVTGARYEIPGWEVYNL